MLRKRFFKKLVIISTYIGVNVIGMPELFEIGGYALYQYKHVKK